MAAVQRNVVSEAISGAHPRKRVAAGRHTVLTRLWSLTRRSARGWLDHEGPRLAASLSFYSLLSLAPLVLLIIAIASLGVGRVAAQTAVISEFRGVLGGAGAIAIRSVTEYGETPRGGGLTSALGILTLLFAASRVFRELQSALNKVWDAPAVQGSGAWAWVRTQLFSLAMALAFLLLVSLLLSAGLATAGGYFRMRVQLSEGLFRALGTVVPFVVTAVLIAVIFKYVPNVKLRWRDVWEGSIAAALLFAAGKALLGEYLHNAAAGSAYGAAGSVIAGFLWVYYSAMIFYFGAEFTRARAQARRGGQRPPPRPLGSTEPRERRHRIL